MNYFLCPIDDDNCWVFGRYRGLKMSGLIASVLGKLGARYDRAIFTLQDKRVLLSQSDPVGDLSNFKLFLADRAIALLWGLRKQAILEARQSKVALRNDSAAAAAR